MVFTRDTHNTAHTVHYPLHSLAVLQQEKGGIAARSATGDGSGPLPPKKPLSHPLKGWGFPFSSPV